MRRVILYSAIVAMMAWFSASATIINVPGDYPTIGAGIGGASRGDTVLVQPGTYNESIGFGGEGITVASTFIFTGDYSDIDSTIIDGEGLSWALVSFGADGYYYYQDAIIGFTIQNGQLGIDCFHNTAPLISFNIIKGNSQHGIWTEMSHPTIIHNVISGNSDSGIYYGLYTESEIYNNVITGNSTGIYILNASPTITNTILWGNAEEIYIGGGSPSFRYCDIQGGWEGEGNINADPLFRNPENGDFHLMADSCGDVYNSFCIDAGDPAIFDSMLGCDWGLGELRSDMGAYGGEGIATGIIDENRPDIPSRFLLHQNYPNPFNAATVIRYSLPEDGFVTISMYNLLGQRVATLYDGLQKSGYHQTVWDAEDNPAGVHFYRIQAGSYQESKKCLLLK